jgi:hypothetical protein
MIRFLVAASAVISVIAAAIYIVMTLRGHARPRPVSWAIWAAILAVGAAASAETGQIPAATYNSLAVIENLAVAVLALRIPPDKRDPPVLVGITIRQGLRPRVKLDLLCLSGAVVGLTLLVVVRNPVLAIVAAMATECLGFIPTIASVWRRATNEPWLVYLLYSGATTLVVIAAWYPFLDKGGMPQFTAIAMPIYLTLADGSVAVLVLVRRRVLARRVADGLCPVGIRTEVGRSDDDRSRLLPRDTGVAPYAGRGRRL